MIVSGFLDLLHSLIYILAISENYCLELLSTEIFATAIIRALKSHGTVLIVWVWSTLLDNQCMYGLEYGQSGCVFCIYIYYISATVCKLSYEICIFHTILNLPASL